MHAPSMVTPPRADSACSVTAGSTNSQHAKPLEVGEGALGFRGSSTLFSSPNTDSIRRTWEGMQGQVQWLRG